MHRTVLYALVVVCAAAAAGGFFVLAPGRSGSATGAVSNQPTASPASAASPVSTPRPAAAYNVHDPATWTDRQLALQLTFTGVAPDGDEALQAAKAGIGGITLLGDATSSDLRSRLAAARSSAPSGIPPMLSSDEEGGGVQQLRQLLGTLPSAKEMGTWSPSRIEAAAAQYGTGMSKLGLAMDFGPVADLDVPGAFISTERRSFSADPATVSAASAAWSAGLAASGIIPVIKHWPGHGSAVNTHSKAAKVGTLEELEAADMGPFDLAFASGAPAVMVGHLSSKGLTEPRIPASLSPQALAYLRAKAGPDTVILTDSLSMGASSTALRIDPAQAAVRALQAGADWALVCSWDPQKVAGAITRAIKDGTLPRDQAEASARRILALKIKSGLLGPG